MKALVTGGTGFLGLYLVEQLVARGDTVRVLSRHPHPRLNEMGVDWKAGDIRDAAAVGGACDGMDVVFHLAGVPGIWGPWRLFYEVNTLGTRHVIEACRTRGIGKLIFTSSPSVIYDGADHRGADESRRYPKKYLCHYPHTKALAEQAILEANGREGLATVALRPHLIWGARDNQLIPRLIGRAKTGRLVRVGTGGNHVSTSYVENAAAAHIQAADALSLDSRIAGNAYFINEPEPVMLWPWIDELLKLAGLPRIRRSISARFAYRIGAAFEAVYRVLPISGEPPMTRFLAQQLAGSHYYDVARAEHDFGYRSIVSVEEGMRRLEPDLKRLAAI
jgi:nucleoside-diphosphate-sugar epimerase